MDIIKEIANKYLDIESRYDGGKSYKWEEAYAELWTLENKAHGLQRRVRTSEGRLLARLLCEEITNERKRISAIIIKQDIKE